MGGLSLEHPWAFAFGLLGNVISFMTYLAPLPTFYRIYRSKSTQGFQSVPYVVALFSAMLWIYYALLKSDEVLLITINSAGCVIETIYIVMYLAYAPKQAKRLVVRTRSVEFMPFSLSLSLTASAVVWFLYGLLIKDKYVALPNILGFAFGVIQMGLYALYCNATPRPAPKEVDTPLPEHIINVAKLGPAAAMELNMPAALQPPTKENIVACASDEIKEISVEKVDMVTNVEKI